MSIDSDYMEELYWEFDGMKKGYGDYKGHPVSERDAFKVCAAKAVFKDREQVKKKIEEVQKDLNFL